MGIQLSLQVFEYENHQNVRTVEIDGEIHFHVNDVCSILEYSNARDALSRHVDAEDVVKHDTLTPGGKQSQNYVTESGLFALIFGSKQKSAKNFKRWVTNEVLPSIRKKGDICLN